MSEIKIKTPPTPYQIAISKGMDEATAQHIEAAIKNPGQYVALEYDSYAKAKKAQYRAEARLPGDFGGDPGTVFEVLTVKSDEDPNVWELQLLVKTGTVASTVDATSVDNPASAQQIPKSRSVGRPPSAKPKAAKLRPIFKKDKQRNPKGYRPKFERLKYHAGDFAKEALRETLDSIKKRGAVHMLTNSILSTLSFIMHPHWRVTVWDHTSGLSYPKGNHEPLDARFWATISQPRILDFCRWKQKMRQPTVPAFKSGHPMVQMCSPTIHPEPRCTATPYRGTPLGDDRCFMIMHDMVMCALTSQGCPTDSDLGEVEPGELLPEYQEALGIIQTMAEESTYSNEFMVKVADATCDGGELEGLYLPFFWVYPEDKWDESNPKSADYRNAAAHEVLYCMVLAKVFLVDVDVYSEGSGNSEESGNQSGTQAESGTQVEYNESFARFLSFLYRNGLPVPIGDELSQKYQEWLASGGKDVALDVINNTRKPDKYDDRWDLDDANGVPNKDIPDWLTEEYEGFLNKSDDLEVKIADTPGNPLKGNNWLGKPGAMATLGKESPGSVEDTTRNHHIPNLPPGVVVDEAFLLARISVRRRTPEAVLRKEAEEYAELEDCSLLQALQVMDGLYS